MYKVRLLADNGMSLLNTKLPAVPKKGDSIGAYLLDNNNDKEFFMLTVVGVHFELTKDNKFDCYECYVKY